MAVPDDVGASAPATDVVVPVEAAPEAKAAPTIDDTLNAAYEKLENPTPRGPDGKFAPRDPAKAKQEPQDTPAELSAEPAAEAETESADQPEDEAVEPEAKVAPAIDTPLSWSAEMKQEWASLTPKAQEYIARRDKETHEAITRLGQEKRTVEDKVKSFEPIDQLVQQHQDEFARRGVLPHQAFAYLLSAQRSLDENPVNGLVQIGLSYGIDLRPIFQGQGEQASPPAYNPEVAGLRSEVSQLKSYLTEQQRREHAAQEAASRDEQVVLQSQIAEFSKDKPYFDQVRQTMGKLIHAGEAETLEQAYDKAIWSVPEIRERILAEQRKTDDDKRRKEQAKKAADASKSAAVNVRSGTAERTTPRSWTETVESEANRLYS